ncbi:NAD-dependent epimerase/dehydratase family protein [Alicyclobacillus tolerans]|uniref:NAD-dependent epimerase/dehydratase family protein n=1 Tax=Alicyclobacillus tolerans TaxID=90970 RepID=UPI001F01E8D8|nr:NAD-dependent epimerase/dehydratase family protein [Alicyclobacillus tolerans]MCF8565769.1 NAD-dependent epimerase/dehydratase family protein [Alicyclobacillus tolerans]
MNILVTGGAGFIASHVVDDLVAAGHQVAVLDNFSTGSRVNVNPDARLYEVDLRDAKRVEDAIRNFKPDVINHHAAQMDVRVSTRLPRLDAEVNIVGSINLIQSAVRHGVSKVVYASTGGAVYGEPHELPVKETHSIQPLSQYGISKHTVEHYLYLYAHNYGLDYTVLRYPNVYGPRQNPHGEAGVIAIFLNRALRKERPTIFGDGLQERDYVFVSDVVNANRIALETGSRQIFNIGSGVGTSVIDIVKVIEQVTGVPMDPLYAEPRVGEIHKIALDASKASKTLGWRPQVPLAKGIEYTYQSLLQNQDSVFANEGRGVTQP